MLEDSNALVFMEAIKTVESLCILMGKAMKQQKLKGFITLLADKFKETKTAPVQAVNKTLQTIYKNKCIPIASMIDHLICQIAVTNKNPKVKQLIFERVDAMITEEAGSIKEDDMVQIFKLIKDKIIAFI